MIETSQQKFRAISWMVFNCVLAASIPVAIKFTHGKLHLTALMAGYNLVATIITIIWVKVARGKFSTKNFFLHFIRALLATAAYFAYFKAVNLTSLANAIAVAYTDAVLTCLFSYIILKEHIHRIDVINLALSFLGAMMIIRPDSDIMNMGAMLAATSALLWSLSNVVTKIIAKKDSVYTQLFYSNFLMFVFFTLMTIYKGRADDIIDADSLGWIGLLGIMAALQAFALFKALNMARAAVIMPFLVVTVISGNFFGYVFFGEIQGMIEMAGTILVIVVGIYQLFHIKLRSQEN